MLAEPQVIKDVSTNFIKEYWEKQAETYKQSHEASWGDSWMIDLEIKTIGQYLKQGAQILDVGCGNGYSTIHQWQERRPASMIGVDLAENMIRHARQALIDHKITGNISFENGDIGSLRFPDNTFDIVYTTRVVINLPTWEQQTQALSECIRVTKKGGTIIFSEAFWEPLTLLNAVRALKNLPPLVEHDFNRYIKKSKLDAWLKSRGITYKVDEFSSVYYLGSRFLRELVTDPAAYPGFTNPINKLFHDIECQFSGGGFGIQQAYILTKPVA